MTLPDSANQFDLTRFDQSLEVVRYSKSILSNTDWKATRAAFVSIINYYLVEFPEEKDVALVDCIVFSILSDYFCSNYFKRFDDSDVHEDLTTALMDFSHVIERFSRHFHSLSSASPDFTEQKENYTRTRGKLIEFSIERLRYYYPKNNASGEFDWEIRSILSHLLIVILPEFSRLGRYLGFDGPIETCPFCSERFHLVTRQRTVTECENCDDHSKEGEDLF